MNGFNVACDCGYGRTYFLCFVPICVYMLKKSNIVVILQVMLRIPVFK